MAGARVLRRSRSGPGRRSSFSSTNMCVRSASRLLTRRFAGFSRRLRPEPCIRRRRSPCPYPARSPQRQNLPRSRDPDGSAYEIDEAGVRIVPRPPVRFLRPAGMLPLPEAVFVDPKEGLRRLKELTLFRNERDLVLSVGFMLDALGGEGPYSVLLIIGEGGAAKSTLAKIIVALVDPRLLPLLNAPASKRDLYINASTRALVAYNNLSYLDKNISDGLCTATEGGAESRRALFTDDDESSIHAKAPFILVAIDNVVTRGDLASRTLKTDLAAFPPGVERLTDLEFWAKFDEAAPVILGALLQALSEGLRRYDSLDQKGLPRLAAFAKFVIACETAFWDAGTFAKAFAESAESAADDVLSDDPIAAVLEEFMEGNWSGREPPPSCSLSLKPSSGSRSATPRWRLRWRKTRLDAAAKSPSFGRMLRRPRMRRLFEGWRPRRPPSRRRASMFVTLLAAGGRRPRMLCPVACGKLAHNSEVQGLRSLGRLVTVMGRS